MYFKDFPQFLYDFNYGNGVTKTSLVRDITRNIRFRRDILANITLFDEYDVIDGETPEIIAEKFYGTPEYHWVVMLANERFDNITDFPLMEPELQRHIATIFNPEENYPVSNWRIVKTTEKNPRGGYYEIHVTGDETDETLSPPFMTADVQIKLTASTTDMSFSYTFSFLDQTQSGFDPLTGEFIQYLPSSEIITGEPNSVMNVKTEGREHNPVYFVNSDGFRVNAGTAGAIAVTGDQFEREVNDRKRRIKIVSPKLLATVLRNYKELL